MAKILFKSADRDAVHRRQASEISGGKYPKATCTEDAHEVVLWSEQPTPDEVESDRADRGAVS
jgi:hypothetical protein